MVGKPNSQLSFAYLARRQSQKGEACVFLACIDWIAIALKEDERDLHRRSLIPVDKRMVAGNAKRVGRRQLGHARHMVSIDKEVLGSCQSGIQESAIPHAIRTAEDCNLLGVKGERFDFTNPNRLVHLLGQPFERIAIAADHAISNFHLDAELFVIRADLKTGRGLGDVNRVALLDRKSVV